MNNFGEGVKQKIEQLKQAPEKPVDSGGISVSLALLGDVKEGDVVQLKVDSIDPEKNEAHLSVVQ